MPPNGMARFLRINAGWHSSSLLFFFQCGFCRVGACCDRKGLNRCTTSLSPAWLQVHADMA